MPEHLIATAAFGLEAVVAQELKLLGYPKSRAEAGRVHFPAERADICRTNLWLRASDRILVEVGTFKAADFDQLFDGVKALPWEDWLPVDAAFPVRGKSVRSQLHSVPACQRAVKKAIVERLQQAYGVAELPETGPLFPIEISLLNNRASLTLDTSGPGLHKRGYRNLSGAAPLKETLAAALVLLSYWNPDRPLLDPFCGSGTIPIEAALIGRNIAPGLQRSFVAENWPTVPPELWREARAEAEAAGQPERPLQIFGSDIDSEAIRIARHHAERAGVADCIEWRQKDFNEIDCEGEYGCIITNPPYGERLGETWEIEDLYRAIPGVLGRFPTWSHYLIISHPSFEKLIGKEADRRRKLYNARIECTYFQFHGPRPPKPGEPGDVDAPGWEPAFGGLPEQAEEQAEVFRRRLEKKAHHLRRWPQKLGISCFRLYDRDIPEVPLVIDRYGDYLHITEYEKDRRHGAGRHEAWLELMAQTAAEVLGMPRRNIALKARGRQVGTTQHERVSRASRCMTVEENGLKFEINLTDYIDTGLFLDHRQTRDYVRKIAKGKDILNLFCYTGSFTVYAAAGEAKSTCSVDLSGNYLDWTARNLELNGFAEGEEHELIRADVFSFLEEAHDDYRFDLAILDPPTFSNSKSTETVLDIQRDHQELLQLTLRRLRPGGVCLFSTNRRKFKFEADSLEGVAEIREITNQTLPPDFQQQGAHRCWRIVRNDEEL